MPIAVAAAHDPEVLKAVDRARREGMVEATLVGDWPAIEAYAAQTDVDLSNTTIIHEPDPQQAAQQVVGLARDGQIGIVVKGQIKTSELLGAALNRHVGIRGRGLLTHVGIFELPGMDRLIYLSDSGVLVYPDVYQKLEIINNVVAVARLLGCPNPGSHPGRQRRPSTPRSRPASMPWPCPRWPSRAGSSAHWSTVLWAWNWPSRPEAAELEESDSPIAGLADVLIVPNVEAGNIVAKGLLYFAHARMAGLVVGAQVPIIISSRADTAETRYLSLAMAVYWQPGLEPNCLAEGI